MKKIHLQCLIILLFSSYNIVKAQNKSVSINEIISVEKKRKNSNSWIKTDNVISVNDDIITKSALNEPVNTQDSIALLDLYRNAVGDNSEEVVNELIKHKVEYWSGIELENGRVTEVNLVDRGMNGKIPSSIGELTALTSLILAENNLTGIIPKEIGNLTMLTNLGLQENNLSGTIPKEIGNLVNLKGDTIHFGPFVGTFGALDLSENNLTGSIPNELGNLRNLIALDLSKNNLSGSIPLQLGNLSNLRNLSFDDNNLSGEIPKGLGNINNLQIFTASNNFLSGEIPSALFYSGSLIALILEDNNLVGELPSSISIPNFGYLVLSSNEFSKLPEISIFNGMPPELGTMIKLDSNKFVFSDLEQFTDKSIDIFEYAPQDSVLLEITTLNNSTELKMSVGGSQTTYEWYYQAKRITGETNNKFTIDKDTDVNDYYCLANNSLLPELTLKGIPPLKEKDCWESGPFIFCLNKGTWEKGEGKDEITTSNQININNFLYFDGTMSIDTAALKIDAQGEFYVQDLPLPGGSIGKYTLSIGEYNLALLGSDGKITNFLNSKLDESAKIFGIGLNLDNLELVGGRNASGIKIGCTISVPGISGSCGSSDDSNTEIKLEGLEITSKGLALGGAQIKDLGLFVDGYCLKNLVYSYDSQKDIFISGMQLALPFGEVGGGFKLEEGLIDSIAWNIEASVSPFVLGSTTIGIKGFFGHISNITKPAIEVELGGIFSDILSDDLYRITASGRTVWPTEFEVKGTGQFLRPILDELPFQLMGNVGMFYDIPNELFKINFGGNFGTADEKTWLIEGGGNFKICHRYDPPKFAGGFDGTINLPKFSDSYPYNWLNTMFTFPINMKTVNRFIWGRNKVVYGTSSFQSAEYGPYTLKYVVDLEKTWEDEDYIVYSLDLEKTKSAIIKEKGGLLSNTTTKTFTISENTDFVVIEINSPTIAPTSTITTPAGIEYSNSSSENNILHTESTDGKESFWSVFNPQNGDWKIELENPGENDTIITYLQGKENEFKFSMNQTGNTVTVNWDVSQVEEGQTVNIMLDDNNADFDGFLVKKGDATIGSLSFTLDENTPDCNYNLFAQLIDEYSVVQSYADEMVNNPLATLSPPENFTSQYNSETGEFEFDWNLSTSPDITGYILTIIDDLENDSVYAILNSNQTNIPLFIEDFETKSAKIESFNQNWRIGCPATINKLTTSIENNFQIEKRINKIKIYPNPTTGNCTIRYHISEPSKCEIMVFNISGRKIAQPFSGFQTSGFHEVNFEYGKNTNGIYLIKFVNNKDSFTVKSILSR